MKQFTLAAGAILLAVMPGLAQEAAAPQAQPQVTEPEDSQPAPAPAPQPAQPAQQPQLSEPAPVSPPPVPAAPERPPVPAASSTHASQPALLAMEDDLVTGVDTQWLSQFVEGLGHTIIQAEARNSEAVVLAQAEGELKYGLIGKACMAEGAADCKGIQLMVIFTPMATPTPEEVNRLNYDRAAVSVWKVPQADGVEAPAEIGVNRYLILDHGQTQDNLALNVGVFIEAAESVRAALEQ